MVQKLSRRLFLSIGTAFTVVVGSQLLSSCGQSPDAPIADTPGEQQEINLYSSRHYNTDNELYAKFTAETGIKVNLIEGRQTNCWNGLSLKGPTVRRMCSSQWIWLVYGGPKRTAFFSRCKARF